MFTTSLGTGLRAGFRGRPGSDHPLPPVLVDAPVLTGTGRAGDALTADPGLWEGVPAGGIEFQWWRDGGPVPGATGPVYVPGPADDRAELRCRITAQNAGGSAVAWTEARRITREAPSVTDVLADVVLTQASGGLSIDAAAVFAGEGITYSVSGGGAVIDPATGIVTLSSDALISGETVTVTGSNSGGAAETGFQFTVKAALLPPVVTAELPDVLYVRRSGAQSVPAQAGFEGPDLEYALEDAPAGAEINATSGLISIPTGQVLRDAVITVRASNAAGSASQTFLVTVYAAETVFEAPEALEQVSFISESGAPSWTHSGGNASGLLVPAASGHLHGNWHGAKGDGLYRCLAYWNSPNRADYEYSPFVFGARIARSGGDFTGVYVEAMRPRKGNKYLQIRQYTGNGTETELLASARPGWMWKVWWWVDVEIEGTRIRARLYREEDPTPDWQVEATTGAADTGAFGPGGFPLNGQSPSIFIKRLEFRPTPAA